MESTSDSCHSTSSVTKRRSSITTNNSTCSIERYVPVNAVNSLTDDVPGYYSKSIACYSTEEAKLQVPTSTAGEIPILVTGGKCDINNDGPVCWKCKGDGFIRKRKKNSNNKNACSTHCSVCKSTGRISSYSKSVTPQPLLVQSTTNMNNRSTNTKNQCGIITRGRKRRPIPNNWNNSNDDNVDDTMIGPEPVGYMFPYWGDIVKCATRECCDKQVIINNDDHKTNDDDDGNEKHGIKQQQHPVWLPKQSNMEQLCNLVGEWRILQRVRSHRWTTDDLVTATIASKELWKMHHKINNKRNRTTTADVVDNATSCKMRYIDLGTGNGSVLQMVLWKSFLQHKQMKEEVKTTRQPKRSPDTPKIASNDERRAQWTSILDVALGVEARKEAVQLARRSIAFNLGDQNKGCSEDVNFTVAKLTNSRDNNRNSTSTNNKPTVEIIHSDFRSLLQNDAFTNSWMTTTASATLGSKCSDNDENDIESNLFDLITGTPPYFQVDFTVVVENTANQSKQLQKPNKDDVDVGGTNGPFHLSTSTNLDKNEAKVNVSTTSSYTNKHNDSERTYVEKATIRQGGMPLSYQSAPARCEFRGGIEDYCYVASMLLRPNTGRFVVCLNYLNHRRAIQSFWTHQLTIERTVYVRGKAGRPILFCVYVLSKQSLNICHKGCISRIDCSTNRPTVGETATRSATVSKRAAIDKIIDAADTKAPYYSGHKNDNNKNKSMQHIKDEEQVHNMKSSFKEQYLEVRDFRGQWTCSYIDRVLKYMSIPSFSASYNAPATCTDTL